MNTSNKIGRLLALFLILCLIAPGAALAAGKSGKKNYKEGVKYEEQQQWDMAAQQFALAVAAEPDNPEYKLHYLRALQQASLMYLKRGDALSEQNDFAGAYTAYRQAANYDQGNELARLKMERMLQLQKSQAIGAEPPNANKIGNVKPASNQIRMASSAASRSRDVVQSIDFKETKFKTVVLNLGRQLGMNVVFDDSVKDVPVTISLTDVTVAKALDIIFKTYKYSFEQVDRRTILVFLDNPTNRPRFESLLVKTFYLGNITAQQARTALQPMLPPGRQIASLDQANTGGGSLLIVKATATELQLIQNVLDSLDKNKNEVVLDVEIYEVGHDSLLELGNQIVTSPLQVTQQSINNGEVLETTSGSSASIANFGGVGRSNTGDLAVGPILGNTFTIGKGLFGTLVGIPPSQIKALQSKGESKLLSKTQIHVLDGQKNTTKVGRSVPVRVGTAYGLGGGGFFGGGTTGQGTGQIPPGGVNQGLVGGFGFPGIDQIQYKDVGLVIEAKPTITNEGYVEVEMKFETSDVQSSGADTQLTPTFTQRSLSTTARIQDGVTSVVAGVNQELKGSSRVGIPVISMVPILGRFFSAPRDEARQTDIIITVTPHIIRSQGINQDDHLANYAGQQASGPTPSVEDVVFRAQQEEEEERRLIARQTPQTVPLETPAQVDTVPAGFNQALRPGAPTSIQPVSNNPATDSKPRVINDRSMVPMTPNSAPQTLPPQDYQVSIDPPPAQQPERQQPRPDNGNPVAKQPPGQTPAQQAAPGQQQGEPGAAKQQTAGAQGTDPAANPNEVQALPPEVASQISGPPQPVEPAVVRSAQRPEHVERAIAKMRAEAERAARENKGKPETAPSQMPREFLPQGPQQKVSQASPSLAAGSPGKKGNFSLNFTPRPVRQQPGKIFSVTLDLSGQEQVVGAVISMRFDASSLKFKSVRGGSVFGAQPDLTYDLDKGNLVVRIKQPKASAVDANGSLVTIDFEALSEGRSEIVINTSGTQVRLAGNTNSPVSGTAVPVIISREAMSNVSNGR